MIKYLTLFVLFLSLLVPFITFSKGYNVETTGEYVMGDSDTKVEARKIALENGKLLAIEQIGTYLESETIVRDGKISKDEIRTYTSGILKTSVISEEVSLLENKTTVFKIRIKSNVDIGTLEQKIKEIKGDKQREQRLDVLQNENIRLLQELEQLSLQLRNVNPTEYKNLRSKRDDLFEKIEKNQNSIRITFEKGTFIQLSKKTDNDLIEGKKLIDDWFDLLKNKVKLKTSSPKIKLNDDKVDIVVDVNYEITDMGTIVDILNKNFGTNVEYKTYSPDYSIWIGYPIPYKGYGFTGINGVELGKYFITKTMDIVLEIGPYRTSKKISSLNYMETKYNVTSWTYHIDLNIPKNTFYLKIIDIPKDELSNIDEVKVNVVVSNKQPKEGRQD